MHLFADSVRRREVSRKFRGNRTDARAQCSEHSITCQPPPQSQLTPFLSFLSSSSSSSSLSYRCGRKAAAGKRSRRSWPVSSPWCRRENWTRSGRRCVYKGRPCGRAAERSVGVRKRCATSSSWLLRCLCTLGLARLGSAQLGSVWGLKSGFLPGWLDWFGGTRSLTCMCLAIRGALCARRPLPLGGKDYSSCNVVMMLQGHSYLCHSTSVIHIL